MSIIYWIDKWIPKLDGSMILFGLEIELSRWNFRDMCIFEKGLEGQSQKHFSVPVVD